MRSVKCISHDMCKHKMCTYCCFEVRQIQFTRVSLCNLKEKSFPADNEI